MTQHNEHEWTRHYYLEGKKLSRNSDNKRAHSVAQSVPNGATHFPWDDGAISGSWLAIGQKSIKTRCNKRVSMGSISLNGHISCAACRFELTQRADDLSAILRDYPQYDTNGAFSNMHRFLCEVLAR